MSELTPVTARAVVQRLNRKLAADYEMVRKSRGGRAELDCGEYYVIDCARNFGGDDIK